MARGTGTGSLESYLIGVTVDDDHGVYIIARNRRTNEYKEFKVASRMATVNIADLSSDGTSAGTMSGWARGDVIELVCSGAAIGSGTHTISTTTAKKGGKVSITQAEVTTTTITGVSI